MTRNLQSSGTEYLKAIRGTLLYGERRSLGAVEKTASGRTAAHALPAPKTFTKVTGVSGQLVKSARHHVVPAPARKKITKVTGAFGQLAKKARHQIDMLIEQNIDLQKELAELVQKETQTRHLTYHDGLTGLPNRSLLQDRFHQAISQAERHHKPLALLMVDLGEFKRVNDKLGYASGDKLLQAVAARLSEGIRGADSACRCGGDKFVILLAEIDSPNIAASLAVEIGWRLSEPYLLDGHSIHIAVSVGVAAYPGDGQTFDDLMKQADTAMYRAKGTGHSISITKLPKEAVVEAE